MLAAVGEIHSNDFRLVKLSDAAISLGVSQAVLRRWLRDGAPVAVPGRKGRGCAMLLNVEDLAAWRDAQTANAQLMRLAGEVSEIVADAIYEVFLQAEGSHKRTLAGSLAACWYLVTTALHDRIRKSVPVAEIQIIPAKIAQLRVIFDDARIVAKTSNRNH